jgi:hypothetical protein
MNKRIENTMYLAQKQIKQQTHYYIRETFQEDSQLKSRVLFDLGSDPTRYIIYPGGKGYYFDEVVEETLRKHGVNPTQDELDRIFWDFLDPEIQRVVRGFENKTKKPLSRSDTVVQNFHLFDKRRIHFLRFGSMDQQHIHRLPDKFFRALSAKSRDEIEQYFMHEERIIRPRELIRYLIVIFGLQQHLLYSQPDQTGMGAQQEKADTLFIESVCTLNKDDTFWAGMPGTSALHEYLRRYVILYFDHAVQQATPIPRYPHEFMNRHRSYRPPKKVRLNMAEAVRLFGTTWEKLRQMDSNTFTRLYRKQAFKFHPDQGGSQKTFVKLTKLYENLMKKKGRKPS